MVRLLHYSKEPLKGVKSVAPKRQGESFKPKGLWVSEDDAWKKWVSQNKFYPEEYVIENEILLEDNANMLHISTLEELNELRGENGDDPLTELPEQEEI